MLSTYSYKSSSSNITFSTNSKINPAANIPIRIQIYVAINFAQICLYTGQDWNNRWIDLYVFYRRINSGCPEEITIIFGFVFR